MSGMPQSVLENTGKILWSNKQWIDLTQAILCHINGMIILPNPGLPQPMWQHDSAIMKNFQGLHLPKNKAIQVNSVQMFLRVSFFSKITNHTRCQLLPEMLNLTSHHTTIFHQSPNQSMLQWLYQPLPGKWHGSNGMKLSCVYTPHATKQLSADPLANGYQINKHTSNGTKQYVQQPKDSTTRPTNACTSNHHCIKQTTISFTPPDHAPNMMHQTTNTLSPLYSNRAHNGSLTNPWNDPPCPTTTTRNKPNAMIAIKTRYLGRPPLASSYQTWSPPHTK